MGARTLLVVEECGLEKRFNPSVPGLLAAQQNDWLGTVSIFEVRAHNKVHLVRLRSKHAEAAPRPRNRHNTSVFDTMSVSCRLHPQNTSAVHLAKTGLVVIPEHSSVHIPRDHLGF